MSVVIPSGYAQGSFGGLVAGDPELCVITVGFELSAPASVSMANDLFDVWADGLNALSTSNWTFEGCSLKEGPTATGATFESTNASVIGIEGQTGTPINTAVLVRKQTALGGRKGRGRMYTVGQAFEGVVGMSGEIDDTHLASLETNWLSIQGGWQAVTGVVDVVLLHSDSTTPTPILGLNPQKRMATQRRRLRP